MTHLILLGDSILDNASYVPGGDPVEEQVRSRLPSGWRVTLLAQDGAIVHDTIRQLGELPKDATHLIVSAGGNDALQNSYLLREPIVDGVSPMDALAEVQRNFAADYESLVRQLLGTKRPTVVCTVYDAVPGLGEVERAALSLFNDVIVRTAAANRLPIIDLRHVCRESVDYSTVSPIEPSEVGGAKIASVIQKVVVGHNFRQVESCIFI